MISAIIIIVSVMFEVVVQICESIYSRDEQEHLPQVGHFISLPLPFNYVQILEGSIYCTSNLLPAK